MKKLLIAAAATALAAGFRRPEHRCAGKERVLQNGELAAQSGVVERLL